MSVDMPAWRDRASCLSAAAARPPCEPAEPARDEDREAHRLRRERELARRRHELAGEQSALDHEAWHRLLL